MKGKINIKLVRKEGCNKPASKNLGKKHAKGEILCYMDEDTILIKENTLKDIILMLTSNSYYYLFGANRYWTNPIGLFEEKSKFFLEKIKNREFDELYKNSSLRSGKERENGGIDLLGITFIACFGFIKSSAFDQVGGFDEEFNSFHDDLLTYKLYKNGFKGKSLKDFDVIHVNHTCNDKEREMYFDKYIEYLKKEGDLDFCTLQLLKKLD